MKKTWEEMHEKFVSFRDFVNSLIEEFNLETFPQKHTRKELCVILKRLYPWQDEANKSGRAYSSMCKKRACVHIDAWLRMHRQDYPLKSKECSTDIRRDYGVFYVPEKDETTLMYFGADNNDLDDGYDSYINYYTYPGKVSVEEIEEKYLELADDDSVDGGYFEFAGKDYQNSLNISVYAKDILKYIYDKEVSYEFLGSIQ